MNTKAYIPDHIIVGVMGDCSYIKSDNFIDLDFPLIGNFISATRDNSILITDKAVYSDSGESLFRLENVKKVLKIYTDKFNAFVIDTRAKPLAILDVINGDSTTSTYIYTLQGKRVGKIYYDDNSIVIETNSKNTPKKKIFNIRISEVKDEKAEVNFIDLSSYII